MNLPAESNRTAHQRFADGWFISTDKSTGSLHSLDLQEEQWWCPGTVTDRIGNLKSRKEINVNLRAVAAAMGEVWKSIVHNGLATNRLGFNVARLDEEDGCVFGRYFWSEGLTIEVLLTFGNHDDAQLIGVSVWSGSPGSWTFEGEAWWPKDLEAEGWLEEAIVSTMRCARGDISEAFEGLNHAACVEY
ncbi:hypothetical protein [Brevibacterium sp.]|uniref:hypothetical protein n=1 Tax=Brevibacterium sp. TaxID=1701 RepID=UPI002811971B|nr:hypothetical protein [Brevibacterium sp.]